MSDELQFEQAEGTAAAAACAGCGGPLAGFYYAIGEKPACAACHARITASDGTGTFARIARATAFGMTGGVAGAAVWWLVAKLTGYELGLIAILVGLLVGKGVALGTRGAGGRGYQFLAVGIAYLSVALGHAPGVREQLPADWGSGALTAVAAFVVALALPFVVPFVEGVGGLMALVILAIALWEAWRFSAPRRLAITGPHPLGDATPPADPDEAPASG